MFSRFRSNKDVPPKIQDVFFDETRQNISLRPKEWIVDFSPRHVKDFLLHKRHVIFYGFIIFIAITIILCGERTVFFCRMKSTNHVR